MQATVVKRDERRTRRSSLLHGWLALVSVTILLAFPSGSTAQPATPTPGGDCCSSHDGPWCDVGPCASCVCGLDPLCCEVAWDVFCSDSAATECLASCSCPPLGPAETPTPRPTPGGDCCGLHTGPGCSEASCQTCVCGYDPSCCDSEWDSVCVYEASGRCAASCACAPSTPTPVPPPPPGGPCCGEHEGAGCDGAGCQACVCAFEPDCCSVFWSEFCVNTARDACAVSCQCATVTPVSTAVPTDTPGPPPPTAAPTPSPTPGGQCCEAHEGPGCDEAACQTCVCAADPLCCSDEWHTLCAATAAFTCLECSCGVAALLEPCMPGRTAVGLVGGQVWRECDSPIIVTGGVVVESGTTLQIEPGVEVRFAANAALSVNGTLIARGTRDKRIVFTSNAPVAAPGDWKGIRFSDTSVDGTVDSLGRWVSGSVLELCDIQFAGDVPEQSLGVIAAQASAPYIRGCRVSQSQVDWGAISFREGSRALFVRLLDVEVFENTGGAGVGGIHVFEAAGADIRGAVVRNNPFHGIDIEGTENVFIFDTLVADNQGTGILLRRSVPNPCRFSSGTISGSRVVRNTTRAGGSNFGRTGYGIHAEWAPLTVLDTVVNGNADVGIATCGRDPSRSVGLTVDHSVVDGNATGGIWDICGATQQLQCTSTFRRQDAFVNMTVRNSLIASNGGNGVQVIGIDPAANNQRGSTGTFEHNRVLYNVGHGILCDRVPSCNLQDNVIAYNGSPVGVAGTRLTLRDPGQTATVSGNCLVRNGPGNACVRDVNLDRGTFTVTKNTIIDDFVPSTCANLGTPSTGALRISPQANLSSATGNNFQMTRGFAVTDERPHGAGQSLNMENNYWGATVASAISERIYDFVHDTSRQLVDFTPFLSMPEPAAPDLAECGAARRQPKISGYHVEPLTTVRRPRSMTVDAAGNAYVLGHNSGEIAKVTRDGRSTTVTADADPSPRYVTRDGLLRDPATGDFFVSRISQGTIVEVPADGGSPSPIAEGLRGPTDLVLGTAANAGAIFIAETTAGAVSKMEPGGSTTVFATGVPVQGLGTGGIAFDAAGSLYVGGRADNAVYKVGPSGGMVAPFVMGLAGRPLALSLAPDGSLLVSEFDGGMIKAIALPGTTTTAFGGGFLRPLSVAFEPGGTRMLVIDRLADTVYRAEPELGSVVFSDDFESGVATGWSTTRSDATPYAQRRFLGQFGNETATLRLSGLDAHNAVTVSFDLFIVRTWDGNNMIVGPDRWLLQGDGATLIDTTFSNNDGPSYPQTYPLRTGAFDHSGRNAAAEVNTLGFVPGCPQPIAGVPPRDAVYRISATFPHSAPTVRLDFSAAGLQAQCDESWGLDNVEVRAATLLTPLPTFTATPTFSPTVTPTRTATVTPTRTSTRTPTATQTPTPTSTSTATATHTATVTSTPTATATATLTATATPTVTQTSTSTPTCAPVAASLECPAAQAAGGPVTVRLSIDAGAHPLGSYAFDVEWDATLLRFDGSSPGTAPEFTAAAPCSDLGGGRARCADFQNVRLDGPTGLVTVAMLHMTSIGPPGPSANVRVRIASLFDTGGVQLRPCNAEDSCASTPYACGDLNADSDVNIGDAQLAAQLDVGLRQCAEAPLVAGVCDVNRDTRCDIGDAVAIAQCDRRLRSCAFECAEFACPGSPLAAAAGAGGAASTGPRATVRLLPREASTVRGDTIVSELVVDTGTTPLGAYSVSIDCDPDVFDVLDPIDGGTAPEFSAPPTQMVAGCRANLAAFQASRLDGPIGSVSVARASFRVKSDAPLGPSTLTIIVNSVYDTNAEPVPPVVENQVVTVEPPGTTATVTPTAAVSSTPATTTPTAQPTVTPQCVGDCDSNFAVTVSELVTMINVALGRGQLSECPVGDPDRSEMITVDEVIQGVNNALHGCGPASTPRG